MRFTFATIVILILAFSKQGFGTSVTKTVGVSGPYDYATLGAALTDINTNGLADTVSLALMDTAYTETNIAYQPITSQPLSLYIYQGGSEKPNVYISNGGFQKAFTVRNRQEFVMYNVILKEGPASSFDVVCDVTSTDEDSRVYIQSGGIIAPNSKIGYLVDADSSAEVNVFGCLVFDVDSIAIDIELNAYPPLSNRRTTMVGPGTVTIDSCTISGPKTGIKISGAISSTVLNISNNDLTGPGTPDAIGILLDSIVVGSLTLDSNVVEGYESGVGSSTTVGSGSFSMTGNNVEARGDLTLEFLIGVDAAVVVEGNTFTNPGGPTPLGVTMAGNKYEVNVRRGSRISAPASIVLGTPEFRFASNHISGFSDVTIFVDDSTDAPITVDGNTVVAGDTVASSPASSMAGNKYEVSVRRGQRFNSGPTGILVGTNFDYTNNDVSGFIEVDVIVDDATEAPLTIDGNIFTGATSFAFSLAGNKYEVNVRRGSRLSLAPGTGASFGTGDLTYSNNQVTSFGEVSMIIDDSTDASFAIDGNTFTGSILLAGAANRSLAGNQYELQYRRGGRASLASAFGTSGFHYGTNHVEGFSDVTLSIEDSTDASISIDSNTVIAGDTLASASSSLAGNKYEVSVRRGQRLSLSADLLIGTDLDYTGNNVSGFIEVDVLFDDFTEAPVTIDGNTFTGATSFASPLAGNKYEVNVRRGARLSLAPGADISSAGDFNYTNNQVTDFSEVLIIVDDSTDSPIAVDGNTFTGATLLAGSQSLAGNQYELQYRRGGRASLASDLLAGTGTFHYGTNQVNGFSEVTMAIADSMYSPITIDGNTFTATTLAAGVPAPSFAGNQYELQYRRGGRASAPEHPFLSSLMSTGNDLTISNNTFTNLLGDGLVLRVFNDAPDTVRILTDANSFIGNGGTGFTVVDDTGDGFIDISVGGNTFSNNANNGMTVMPMLGQLHFRPSVLGNTFSNNTGTGLLFEGGDVVDGLHFQNFVNNGNHVHNSMPQDIDATLCWWGTTDPAIISSKIIDDLDTTALGLVYFIPFLGDSLSGDLKFVSLTPDSVFNEDPLKPGKSEKPVKRGKSMYPNWSNLLDEVNAQGGFGPATSESDSAGGLLVGSSFIYKKNPGDPLNPKWSPVKDSAAIHCWVRLGKWDFKKNIGKSFANIQKTLFDKNAGMHSGPASGLDTTTDGKRKLLVKQLTSLSPKKQNNALFAELVALKVNIAASLLGKTPAGFGDLIFDQNGSPFDEMSIMQIDETADLMMTLWNRYPSENFDSLLNAVQSINQAFIGRLDTITFETTDGQHQEGKLTLRGQVSLAAIPFLKAPQPFVPTRMIAFNSAVESLQDFGEEEDGELDELPFAVKLYQNYPNPFNPSSTISFRLKEASSVTLRVFNILGQHVATLLENDELEGGYQAVEFSPTQLASGVYFYQIDVRDLENNSLAHPETRKMLLLK